MKFVTYLHVKMLETTMHYNQIRNERNSFELSDFLCRFEYFPGLTQFKVILFHIYILIY